MSESGSFEVEKRIEQAWSFLSEPRNLARCLPGFLSFEQKSETHSIWKIKIELPSVSRVIQFAAHIDKMEFPAHALIILEGISDKASGFVEVNLKPIDSKTQVSFVLSLKGEGVMAPLVNALISKVVPKVTKEFVENVKTRFPLVSFKAVSFEQSHKNRKPNA